MSLLPLRNAATIRPGRPTVPEKNSGQAAEKDRHRLYSRSTGLREVRRASPDAIMGST